MKLRNKQYPKVKLAKSFKEVKFADKPTHVMVDKALEKYFTVGKVYPLFDADEDSFRMNFDNFPNAFCLAEHCAHLGASGADKYIFLKEKTYLIKV